VDFEELYQDVILDHSRRPRNYGELPAADFHAHGDNPNCGDEVTVHLKLGVDDVIEGLSFTGNGCSICMASASLMTLKMKRKSRAESAEMIRAFHQMLTGETETEPDKSLGDLRLLKGVRKFPQRVKCATLAWHALEEALAKPPSHSTTFSIDPELPS
jgi:nitrogen fixation protein NifU and related proteins